MSLIFMILRLKCLFLSYNFMNNEDLTSYFIINELCLPIKTWFFLAATLLLTLIVLKGHTCPVNFYCQPES